MWFNAQPDYQALDEARRNRSGILYIERRRTALATWKQPYREGFIVPNVAWKFTPDGYRFVIAYSKPGPVENTQK